MGYQVIVTPAFTGPGLPDLAVPGFADDFNRADSLDLGVTSTGNRPWRTSVSIEGADALAQIKNQQLGAAGTTGYSVASADAHAVDVRVEATIAYADASLSLTPNLRLVARAVSASPAHFVSLRFTNLAGSESLWIDSYVPGQSKVTAQSGVLGDLTGRRIALQAVGDAFSAYLDDTQVIAPTTITGLAGITTHGVQANNSANTVRFDDITVATA